MSSGGEIVGLVRRLIRTLSSLRRGWDYNWQKTCHGQNQGPLTVLCFEEQCISSLFSIIVYVYLLSTIRTV